MDHEEEEDYQGDQEEAEQADHAGLQEHNKALAAKYLKVVRVDLDKKKLDYFLIISRVFVSTWNILSDQSQPVKSNFIFLKI